MRTALASELTPAQRVFVHPLRGDDVAPFPHVELGRRMLRDWCRDEAAYWKRGVKHAAPAHADGMRRALDIAAGDAPAVDAECEASLLQMLDYETRRGFAVTDAPERDTYVPVDQWFVTRWLGNGIPFALDVLAAAPRFGTDGVDTGGATSHALVVVDAEVPGWWALENGHIGLLYALRRGVVAHPRYDDGVAAATKLRDTAPPWLRAAIAFVFPDEAAFSAADAAAAMPKGAKQRTKPWSWGLVTTRLADDAQLRRILESLAKDDQSYLTGTERYGWSLVARLGVGARPLIEHALEGMRGKSAKQGWGEALAAVGGGAAEAGGGKPKAAGAAGRKPETRSRKPGTGSRKPNAGGRTPKA